MVALGVKDFFGKKTHGNCESQQKVGTLEVHEAAMWVEVNLVPSNIKLLLMAKILRSPVEVGSLSYYLQGLDYIPGGWEWDFSHQH